jgi:tight adherence protein C
MSPMLYALLSFLVVVGVTFAAAMLAMQLLPAVRRDRLAAPTTEAGASGSILRYDEEDRPAWQQTVERIGRRIAPKDAGKLGSTRLRLAWAGLHGPHVVPLFFGAKVVAGVVGAIGYPFLGMLQQRVMPNALLVSVVLAVAGFFLPDFWLRSRTQARQRDIVNALPDVLDLLMVCVEAGMGFDAAVARVAEQPQVAKSPLHQEMLRMHLEVRAGRPRDEGLRAFGERTGVQEVKSMVGAFIQTERLGTPLGKTLRVHADSARVQRRHRAEERAYLAPLKMIFPTVLFLMPAFFLVAMAPPLLGLIQVFRTLGGGGK